MKKKYFVPEVEITRISCEGNFVATADNLTINSTYKDNYSEDEFWD